MEIFSPFTNLEFWDKLLREVTWSQALTLEKYKQLIDLFVNLEIIIKSPTNVPCSILVLVAPGPILLTLVI